MWKALLLLASFAPQSASIRLNTDGGAISAAGSAAASVQQHPVHILLTRHGLSCANIVSNWGQSMWSKKNHIYMKDPLLCEAGRRFSEHARDKVQPALDKLGLPRPDAVLSSVLARAMETAALQYPGYPIYVMPYVRESGFGADNDAEHSSAQVSNLRAVLGDSWNVNYQYVNAEGYDHAGDWQKFKHFLQTTFLPDLIRDLKKPSGEPIVLAVVSHSNFMNEGEVYKECKQAYEGTTKKKAENNQAVKLSYTFTETLPGAGAVDVTPMRSLKSDGSKCVSVVRGVAYKDSDGDMQELCQSDVGSTCWQQITTQGGGSFPWTQEDKIQDLKSDLESANKKLQKAEAQQSTSTWAVTARVEARTKVQELESAIEQLSKTQCWSGGLPRADGR